MMLRPTLIAATVLCTALVLAAPLAAQQTAAAADTAAVLSSVADESEARGDAPLAEAILRHIVERYPGTPAAVEARSRLEAFQRGPLDRSGAIELQVWSTLYGLWLGVAVPGSFEAENPEPYGIGLLLGGPAGFLAAQQYLSGRPISVGQARAITWGGTWGSWQGYGWGDVLGLTDEESEQSYQTCVEFDPATGQCRRTETVTYSSDAQDAGKVVTSVLLGGLAGLAAGSIVAGRGEISPGTATLVNFGSLWGTWYALALGVIANQDEDDDRLLLWTLLGGNAGLVGTAMIAPGYDVSRTRARLINIAGVVGLLGGFGIDLLVQPEGDAALFGIPMVTSAAGLALGVTMTRDHDSVAGREERGRGAIGGSALLQVRDGRAEFGMPVPVPTFRPAADRFASGREPALRLTLLDARF